MGLIVFAVSRAIAIKMRVFVEESPDTGGQLAL
jgi:hypothetical protein